MLDLPGTATLPPDCLRLPCGNVARRLRSLPFALSIIPVVCIEWPLPPMTVRRADTLMLFVQIGADPNAVERQFSADQQNSVVQECGRADSCRCGVGIA